MLIRRLGEGRGVVNVHSVTNKDMKASMEINVHNLDRNKSRFKGNIMKTCWLRELISVTQWA